MYNYKENVFNIAKLSRIQNKKQNASFCISSLKRKRKKKKSHCSSLPILLLIYKLFQNLNSLNRSFK